MNEHQMQSPSLSLSLSLFLSLSQKKYFLTINEKKPQNNKAKNKL